MGILSRIVTVIKSNINEMISKSEDPKKMLEQIIMDMNEKLVQAKQEVAASIADEKRLQKAYEQARQNAQNWARKAEIAVDKGDDNLAMEALKRQSSEEDLANQYEQQWLSQKNAVDQLKTALIQLQNKIQEAGRKKNLLIARQKRAEAQSKINKTMSSLSDSGAFDTFARMEEKVNQIEATSDAENELNREIAGSDLDEKFKQLESSSNVEDKLAALKARLGKN